jgi:uncharacterized protein YeaO (DUF488 family)
MYPAFMTRAISSPRIALKRACEKPSPHDGYRVLVDAPADKWVGG